MKSQKYFLALGKCLKVAGHRVDIHFIGHYRGHYINRIVLNGDGISKSFEKNSEYLLYLEEIKINKTELISKLISHKEINDTFIKP